MAFTSIKPSYADTQGEQMIRIGVVPSAETIMIGSDSAFKLHDKESGDVLFTGFNDSIEVTLESTAEIQTNYRLQVAYTTSNAYIEDWLNRAQIGGYTTYVKPFNDGYRLFLGEFPEDASWSERNAFRNEVIANGLAENDSFWKLVTVASGESQIKVLTPHGDIITSSPVLITSDDGLVKLNGKTYRGSGEIAFNSSGTLVGINELSLESYLYGVVPLELPPVPYGELEAQKAQAVAARTYAYANLGKRNADGYDLLPTTSDQVYGGFEREHPVSTQAVEDTFGVVATYNGDLITAVYHSTSGGYTANNEDVWNAPPVPYLRGVPDSQNGKAFDYVPNLNVFKNHANPKSLRAIKKGDFEADWSKYHRWTFEWSMDEISNVVGTYFNKDIETVYDINVTRRSDSGRALEIEFITDKGTFYEYKDRIRWALKYINASGSQSVLLSTLFYIEPIENKKTKELEGYKVYGGGWGHGVGMSQTGAMGMAVKGYSYDNILKHYYQGIQLETR